MSVLVSFCAAQFTPIINSYNRVRYGEEGLGEGTNEGDENLVSVSDVCENVKGV